MILIFFYFWLKIETSFINEFFLTYWVHRPFSYIIIKSHNLKLYMQMTLFYAIKSPLLLNFCSSYVWFVCLMMLLLKWSNHILESGAQWSKRVLIYFVSTFFLKILLASFPGYHSCFSLTLSIHGCSTESFEFCRHFCHCFLTTYFPFVLFTIFFFFLAKKGRKI